MPLVRPDLCPVNMGNEARRPRGLPFVVEAGQRYSGVRLSMAPVGSVSGRVLNASGEPAEGARMGLVREAYRDGVRSWAFAQTALTDDRGEYRFYSLPPGKYYVSAAYWDNRSTRVPNSSEPSVYPNRFAGQQTYSSPMVIHKGAGDGRGHRRSLRPCLLPWNSGHCPRESDSTSNRRDRGRNRFQHCHGHIGGPQSSGCCYRLDNRRRCWRRGGTPHTAGTTRTDTDDSFGNGRRRWHLRSRWCFADCVLGPCYFGACRSFAPTGQPLPGPAGARPAPTNAYAVIDAGKSDVNGLRLVSCARR